MKLGFDLDEVVVNIIDPTVAKINEINGTNYSPSDITDYGMRSVGVDGMKFFEQYGDEILYTAEPKGDAIKILQQLSEDGHEIAYISARDNKTSFIPSYEWLIRHSLPVDYLGVNKRGVKHHCAYNLQLDLFVDDCYEELERIQPPVKRVIFDAPWNQGVDESDMFRVSDWDEIYQLIKSLQIIKSNQFFKRY